MRTLIILGLTLLTACATPPTPAERQSRSDELAATSHWQAEPIRTGSFELLAYRPQQITPQAQLTIYIEGDGLAWLSSSQASADPTPIDPLALRLALAQPVGNAVYLGRPCQYGNTAARGCAQRYWTDARFAPEVISATSQAIDQLKTRFGASELHLVGYSGGAAVAALIAAERKDVRTLISVAGNLDQRAWTRLHRITPLRDSLNPADRIDRLASIRQWHWVGAQDSNITPALIQDFAQAFPAKQRPIVRSVPGFDHRCCWAEQWPALWREASATLASPPYSPR